MTPSHDPLIETAARLLRARVAHADRMAGGDLSAVWCLGLEDGRRAVVKGGPSPRAEAAMLAALADAGVPAPAVLAVSDAALVLEALPEDGRLEAAWDDLGGVVAHLHAAGGTRYGWADPYAFGHVPIANDWADDWPGFWGERRLLALQERLPRELAARTEKLAQALDTRLPAHPRPSLLHGDLWSGNVLAANGRVSGLIDPACYYGHAEVDLAMLTLFARPGEDFFAAYGPLEPGFIERQPIYQLWPALVHFGLFGAGYAPMVTRLLDAAGA